MKKVIFYIMLFTFYLPALMLQQAGFSVYSQTPTQQWVARYLRPAGSSAIPNQMALDKVGNCYVLGNIPISGGIGGILLIKYNSVGDTVWTRSYNIGSGNTAANIDVTADSIGNVYITGYIGPTFGPYDIVLVKYDVNGTQQWIRTYAGAGNISDSPGGITLDRFGRPYLAGVSGNDALIVKYNTDGDSIWVRRFNIAGYRSGVGGIAVNPQGYIYAGGHTRLISSGAEHYLVVRYDSNGVFQWYDKYTSTGFESPRNMATDIFDNCYLTGDGSDGVTDGGLTIKYNPAGIRLWVKAFSYGVGTDANDIVADVNGNAYITGSYSLGSSNYNYITLKYNPVGDTVWVRTYNGTANDNDEAYSISIDDSSNVYVTGRSIRTNASFDYATIKYSANGNQQWLAIYNGLPGNATDIANVVKVDRLQNVYVTGISDRGGLIYDYATVKYNQPLAIEPIASELPNRFYLYQNYSNPFNSTTVITYALPKKSNTKLFVYTINGQLVKALVNSDQNSGYYSIAYNAGELSSGVYFYQLLADNKIIDTKKFVLIK